MTQHGQTHSQRLHYYDLVGLLCDLRAPAHQILGLQRPLGIGLKFFIWTADDSREINYEW